MNEGGRAGSATSKAPPASKASPATVSLTFSEAAAAVGMHPSSLRRRFAKGQFPNAYRIGKGPWRIPVADLVAAGIELRLPEDGTPNPPTPAQEIQQLRDRLNEVTGRAELAEAALR